MSPAKPPGPAEHSLTTAGVERWDLCVW